jgi:PilZ domain
MDKVRSKPSATQAPPRAAAAAEIPSQGSPEGQGGGNIPVAEKRSDVRYPVSAEAVLIDHRSRTRLNGRAADLSLAGCYLDATQLLPVGVSVRLRLSTETRSFECEAQVVYALQGLGMVLVFVKISPDQAAELHNWIAELSGTNRAATHVDSMRNRTASSPQQRSSRGIRSQ